VKKFTLHFFIWELRSVGAAPIREGTGWVRKHEKRSTANRREPQSFALLSASDLQSSLESALRARQSDLLILTLAIQLRCLARPFIGTVRANPVAAQRLPTAIPLSVSFCDCQKRTIISYVMINQHLSHGRRWGADRICPNGPDEGRASRGTRLVRVRICKSDSGSKPKACGIRADSRLVFLHVSTPSNTLSKLEPHPHRVTPI